MTLPGGPADKLGNRYETWWSVSECVRLLGGGTDTIPIEILDAEKAEFTDVYGMEDDFKAEVEVAFDGMIEQEVNEEVSVP